MDVQQRRLYRWPDHWGPEENGSVDWSHMGQRPGVCAGGIGGIGGPGGASGRPGDGGSVAVNIVSVKDLASNLEITTSGGASRPGAGCPGGKRGAPGALRYDYNNDDSPVPQPPPAGDPSGTGLNGPPGAASLHAITWLSSPTYEDNGDGKQYSYVQMVPGAGMLPDLWYIKYWGVASGTAEISNAIAEADFKSSSVRDRPTHYNETQAIYQMVEDAFYALVLQNEGVVIGYKLAEDGYDHYEWVRARFIPNVNLQSSSALLVGRKATLRSGNGPDLYMINSSTQSGKVEVHSATFSSDYKDGADWISGVNTSDAAGAVFRISDGSDSAHAAVGDLFVIRTANTASGCVELVQLTQASGYQTATPYQTWIPSADAAHGRFWMIGADLYFIRVNSTASGKIEIYRAAAAIGYQRPDGGNAGDVTGQARTLGECVRYRRGILARVHQHGLPAGQGCVRTRHHRLYPAVKIRPTLLPTGLDGFNGLHLWPMRST